MILLETMCVLALLVSTTACQLNPKLATPTDEVYGDRGQVFIHHPRKSFSDKYDIYIDNQKRDINALNEKGFSLPYGAHAIDIIDKRTSKKVKHFDVYIEKANEKHFNLCTEEQEEFILADDQDPNNTCIKKDLN